MGSRRQEASSKAIVQREPNGDMHIVTNMPALQTQICWFIHPRLPTGVDTRKLIV
jgi:hypothetical protein